MLAHEWYDANFDEELRMDRQRAKDLCFEYNHTRPSDREKRQAILKNYLAMKRNNFQSAVHLTQIMVGI